MKARELCPLFKDLLREMPGFAAHKSQLLMTPMNGLLRAIDFDSSAFDRQIIYPATMVMPLCVPTDHIHLLFGHRLSPRSSREVWRMTMPDLAIELSEAIRQQGLPFLARATTLLDFVELVDRYRGNPHTPKSIAFALARAGETRRAIAEINAFLPKLDLRSHWQQTIADQSTELRDLLVSDPEAAQVKLSAWESYTIEKLGLQAFR